MAYRWKTCYESADLFDETFPDDQSQGHVEHYEADKHLFAERSSEATKID